MRGSKLILGAAVVLLTTGSVAACARVGQGGRAADGSTTETTTAATSTSSSRATTTSRAPTTRQAPTTTRTSRSSTPQQPAGEIWEWAIGRNAFDDPALFPYTRELGRRWDTDVDVQSLGFLLTLDSSGVVTTVTLVNDESRLGYPGSDSNFRAYAGRLPGGVSWKDTATTLGAEEGAPNQSLGGWGIEYTFTFHTDDGYGLDVTFAARHSEDLPGAPIHMIAVRRL